MSYKKNKNKEFATKKIKEKDDCKEEYNKKIGDIKVRNGINFSIDYLKDNKIDSIIFSDLEYQKKAKNISVFYNSEYNDFNAISYELYKNKTIKDINDVTLIDKITNKYKLHQVINEIEVATNNYREQLKKIDNKYKEKMKEQISNSNIEIKKENKI